MLKVAVIWLQFVQQSDAPSGQGSDVRFVS